MSRPLLFPRQHRPRGRACGSRAVCRQARGRRRRFFLTRFLLAKSQVGFRALSGPGDVTARARSLLNPEYFACRALLVYESRGRKLWHPKPAPAPPPNSPAHPLPGCTLPMGLLLPRLFVSRAGDWGVCSRPAARGALEQAFSSNLSPGCVSASERRMGSHQPGLQSELFQSSSPFRSCQQPMQKVQTLPWPCRRWVYARPVTCD